MCTLWLCVHKGYPAACKTAAHSPFVLHLHQGAVDTSRACTMPVHNASNCAACYGVFGLEAWRCFRYCQALRLVSVDNKQGEKGPLATLIYCRTRPCLQQVCRFQGSQGVFGGTLQPQRTHNATDKVERLCWSMRVCRPNRHSFLASFQVCPQRLLAASRCWALRAGVPSSSCSICTVVGRRSGCVCVSHATRRLCLQRSKSDTPACCSGCVREWAAFQSCLFEASRRVVVLACWSEAVGSIEWCLEQ